MTDNAIAVCIFLVVIAFSGGIFLGGGVQQNYNQKQAISRGYALYCPDNGDFAWVGECDEE